MYVEMIGRPSAMASIITTGIFSEKLGSKSARAARISVLTCSPVPQPAKIKMTRELSLSDSVFDLLSQRSVSDQHDFAVDTH